MRAVHFKSHIKSHFYNILFRVDNILADSRDWLVELVLIVHIVIDDSRALGSGTYSNEAPDHVANTTAESAGTRQLWSHSLS